MRDDRSKAKPVSRTKEDSRSNLDQVSDQTKIMPPTNPEEYSALSDKDLEQVEGGSAFREDSNDKYF